MKKGFLKTVCTLILLSMMLALIPASISAESYDVTVTEQISGIDCKVGSGKVFLYPNKTDKVRVVKPDEYGFRYYKLMIFDKDGMLIEAGGELFENSATVTGSPQTTVKIPAGGFMIAFSQGGAPNIMKAFNVAMEGAMLYNATMSVIYPVKASYTDTTVTLQYNNPKSAPANAKKFLFVGNSSTYFNGTPIKFKGLAEAAGAPVDVIYCTFGSAFLSEFADASHVRGSALRNKLKEQKYDYVVLQDASSADYYSIKSAVATILPLIKENGAEAVLYKRYSAASTLEQNTKNAKRHHDNYTKVANDFSLKCSPAADAFIYVCEKYPEINLYADDGGHHSKEGSYLIACCWLYSYLGIDPVGNSYTAQMDAETVRKLQECAKLAVEEGYPFDEATRETYKGQDGKTYVNLSTGKKYTVTGGAYDGKWTDTGSDGKPLGKLTDGVYASSGSATEIGAYKSANQTVTIDLGEISAVVAIKTDLWGNTGWGIQNPEELEIKMEISNDGKTFTEVAKPKAVNSRGDGDWKGLDYIIDLASPVNARYVRVSYLGGNFVWASEIAVFGETYKPEAESVAVSEPLGDIVEDENASLAWVYWLIGGLVLIAVICIAVFITKKKK
ncbi:MAG: discoidin domain-containing protein [Clostridia bacterium]|nr:discoidin domain-containing protein [Clostridia bacterium]